MNRAMYEMCLLCFLFIIQVNGISFTKPRKIVVIGGGWSGFSAADALARIKQNQHGEWTGETPNATHSPAFDIEILDASPRGPGGLAARGAGTGGARLGAQRSNVQRFWSGT